MVFFIQASQTTRNEPLLKIHADIAGSAQLVLEDAILFMCEKAKDLTNCTNLAYAGGVALNIDANSRIYDSGLFGRISIHPASYDGGTSIGAGYLAHLEKTGHRPRSSSEVFLGTEIRVDGQIDEYCRAHGLSVTTHTENGCIASAVSRLAKREIIGWISGRMEIGPRALTHRSILSHPSVPRADVNRIKQREPFRPFAPIVLQDRLYDIFEGGPRESPHMLYKYNVRKPYHDLLAGVVHVDNSARVQTIADTPELSRTFKLLTAFAERTGLPVLLNTSFNLRGQPLVNTGIQALEVLLGTDLASVYIDNFEFAKK